MIGTKLAHYEITSHLGTGGMGEVYQATDSKLGRSVAIKLLPEAFTDDADRVTRFEREARLLASLNHPNIAAIYGVEVSALRKFLVMELVPGLTLAERIERGPIPVEETLAIAKQIAEGLEAAHEKGIIHRDLKPANVKITPDGRVKLLDFGLSKAFVGELGDASRSNSPTLSIAATNAGVILGTAAYMSPEQAKGIEVDKRADIWAFGVVLFEMLSGTRLFDEPTNSETLAAVLKSEIRLQALPASCPSALRLLIQRCLDRDQRRRLRDIGEARVAIESAAKEPEPIAIASAPPLSRFRSAAWIAVGALGAALIVTAWTFLPKAEPLKPLIRLEVDFGPDASFTANAAPEAILSPDGSRLVYLSRRRLFTRRLDESKATELAGTEGATNPFFSPDGQWVAFFAKGQLSKIRLDGGAPVALCEASGADGRSRSSSKPLVQLFDCP
jgi:serine/threonine protein kinase